MKKEMLIRELELLEHNLVRAHQTNLGVLQAKYIYTLEE
jgi:hypothetical protein